MKDFITDYGALVAPISAVVNGFIAILVANFYKDNTRAKVILVVSAGLLGIVGISATILNQRAVLAAKVADQAKNKATRDVLGTFIAEGLKLIADCSDSSVPPRWAEMNKWMNNLREFLQTNMGAAYVARITSPAGVPLNVACRGADEAHNNLYRVVNAVNFRLEQFISEVGR